MANAHKTEMTPSNAEVITRIQLAINRSEPFECDEGEAEDAVVAEAATA